MDEFQSIDQLEQTINILVIDDQQLFIEGLVYVLNSLADRVEISQANNIEQAINKLANCDSYDIIMLDLNMPGMGGFDFLQQVSKDELFIPVVIISAEQEAEQIQQALALGAMGFIPKSYNAKQMVSAIRTVLEGNMYVPGEIQKRLNSLPL